MRLPDRCCGSEGGEAGREGGVEDARGLRGG